MRRYRRFRLQRGVAKHCYAVARELQTHDRGSLPRLIIGVIDSEPDGESGLIGLLDFVSAGQVFEDPERATADRLAVPGSPFVYAIDREGRVRAKQAAIDALSIVRLKRFTV